MKNIIILLIFIVIYIYFLTIKEEYINNYRKEKYFDLLLNHNNIINFKKRIKKINFGIYIPSLSNGGRERITALLLNSLSNENIFTLYLLTKSYKNKNEFQINNNIKRIVIKNEYSIKKNLIKYKIKVFVYQNYNIKIMKILNNIKEVKTIFYNHSCFLFWIYRNGIPFLRNLYSTYRKMKYVISLIPLENDYLFKKWGINSILMNNLITYNNKNDKIIPSDLSSKNILMIGRGDDELKRFYLGIESMKYITKEIQNCEMLIISEVKGIKNLINLVKKLRLKNNIKFVGYTNKPEIFFKKASLHILPSICECFPMALSETKIFGIPNILLGIDYISPGKGGIIYIYDDKPETIAKEAIKILTNYNYRKKLGKSAIDSMKNFRNEITIKKWIHLILSVYYGDKYYIKLKNENKKMNEYKAIKILKRQLKILKMRKPKMKKLTLNKVINFNFSF